MAVFKNLRLFNQIGVGKAKVEQVGSNRRILGQDGKMRAIRLSATKDAAVRAEPEALMEPCLRTLSFWYRDHRLSARYYYATHPMNNRGNGRISTDFCGLTMRKRQEDNPGVSHVYSNGCVGIARQMHRPLARQSFGNAQARLHLNDAIWESRSRRTYWESICETTMALAA